MINNLSIYGLALAAGGAGALAVAIFGKKWALLDKPNERSSHERAVPRGGGIGVLAAFIVCSLLLSVPPGFWVPAAILALVSFIGDRFEVGVSIRLLAQFLMALCFLLFAGGIHVNGLPWTAVLIFYLLFVVGTANFYNFMDGINGIAGITGMVAFGLLGFYGVLNGKDPALIVLCFVMVCACAGFLPFNLPRARVFMGDVGSILLGFVFACLVVKWAVSLCEFLIMSGFLFLFYTDELVTLVERLFDGESPTRAHRRHLYQVLANEGGLAHWRVTTGYGLAQLLIGLVVWKVGENGRLPLLGVMILFLVVFIFFNNRIKDRYLRGS